MRAAAASDRMEDDGVRSINESTAYPGGFQTRNLTLILKFIRRSLRERG